MEMSPEPDALTSHLGRAGRRRRRRPRNHQVGSCASTRGAPDCGRDVRNLSRLLLIYVISTTIETRVFVTRGLIIEPDRYVDDTPHDALPHGTPHHHRTPQGQGGSGGAEAAAHLGPGARFRVLTHQVSSVDHAECPPWRPCIDAHRTSDNNPVWPQNFQSGLALGITASSPSGLSLTRTQP